MELSHIDRPIDRPIWLKQCSMHDAVDPSLRVHAAMLLWHTAAVPQIVSPHHDHLESVRRFVSSRHDHHKSTTTTRAVAG
jgi:hypothetical protein